MLTGVEPASPVREWTVGTPRDGGDRRPARGRGPARTRRDRPGPRAAVVGAVLAGAARRASPQAGGIRRAAGRRRRPPARSSSPGGAVSMRTHTRARVALPALALLAALTAACGGGAGDASTTTAQPTASQTGSASTVADNGLQLANKPQDCLTKVQRTRAVDRALREAARLKRMAAPLP